MNNIYISPSLLSADFSNLEKEIKEVEESGADYLHLDIMDGHFVPNLTFGPFISKFIKNISKLPLDVHLMVEKPEDYIPQYAKMGAEIIVVHQEACTHLHRQIQLIKSFGAKAGVALNPATPLETLDYIIEDLDLVLIMSVNPGYSGQKFIESSVRKIENFHKKFKGRLKENFLLEVDGGVNNETAPRLIKAGANMLVSGSYYFKSENKKEIISLLKKG